MVEPTVVSTVFSYKRHWPALQGPLLTVVGLLTIELLVWLGIALPTPTLVFLLTIVYAVFKGGLLSGLTSAAISIIYTSYFFSTPGTLFHYSPENMLQVLEQAVVSPLMALLVNVLKQRTEQRRGDSVHLQELRTSLENERQWRQGLRQAIQEKDQTLAQEQASRIEIEQLAAEHAAILQQIVDGVIIADPYGQITFVNEAARRLYGVSEPTQSLGADIALEQRSPFGMHPYQLGQIPLAKAIIHGQTVLNQEWRIQRPDGSTIIAQGSAAPVVSDQGTRLGAVLVIRDVTSQRELERQKDALLAAHDQALAEAKEAQRRLSFLAEASVLLSASLDYEATLASVAHLAVPYLADWCTIHILDEDQAIRRLAVAHIDPIKEQMVRERPQRYPLAPNAQYIVPQVLRTGRPEIYPQVSDDMLVAAARDAEHLQIMRTLGFTSYMCLPLTARGRTLGAITLVSGESGRRYTQEDQALAEDLAWRAAIAVDNAHLYHQAQQAIRARDQFLSIASHELKTPLTSLLGNAQLLQRRVMREGTLNERDQRALHVIVEQTVRLNKMVVSLLDLSRIETGQLSIERNELDLRRLAQRIVEEVQPSLEYHTVSLHSSEEPLLIVGDELRLEQVIQNLISNAIKYSPMGGPIDVLVERCGDQACVSVKDCGLGIPQGAQASLFQRFYRAPNVEAQHIGGMGLGLHVVKEIVALHNGTVHVTSTEGQGSTFTVCFPVLMME